MNKDTSLVNVKTAKAIMFLCEFSCFQSVAKITSAGN
jgi:hypothetical protein